MNHLTKLFLLVGLISQPALARHRPDLGEQGKGGGPGGELKEALKSLDLTDEQKSKIKEIRKASGESNKEARNALKEGRKGLEEAMKGDAKKADLLSKFDSLQGLRTKLARGRFEMMLGVREILTPEQRQKFRSFMEEHKGRRFGKEAEQD